MRDFARFSRLAPTLRGCLACGHSASPSPDRPTTWPSFLRSHAEAISAAPANAEAFEVTEQEGHRLKAMAALRGKSIKEFVLESRLGTAEGKALAELEALLRERAARVEAGELSTRTVEEIVEARIDQASSNPDA